ncbi:MAG TPA: hypothetical protein VLN61_09700 [Pseudolabrys sp.]|nr:hypothetical protein [Pseudolabrys sp.]
MLAKNTPLPGGGWVATQEDVTEQRHAELTGPGAVSHANIGHERLRYG